MHMGECEYVKYKEKNYFLANPVPFKNFSLANMYAFSQLLIMLPRKYSKLIKYLFLAPSCPPSFQRVKVLMILFFHLLLR